MKIDLPPLKPRALAVRTHPGRQRRSGARVRPARRAARAGHHHRDVRRRAVRGARSGDQGVARRRRLREVVLRRRRLPVGAVVGRVHRHLRRARSGRDRRRAGRLPRLPGERGLVLRRDDRRGSRPPGRALPARHRVGRAATWRRWPTSPVGSPLAYLIAPPLESIVGLDAACKAGRVQHRQVVRPAVGDELRRRLPGGRSARLRGGGARVRRRDRRRLRGAARAPIGPRRRREHGARAARARPTAAPRRAASARSRPASASRDEARSPDPPRRRRVAGAEDAPAHRRARQAGSAAVGAARRAGRRRRRRRARAGRRAGRDPGAGARAGRRRGDRPRGAAPDVCSAWAPTSCATRPTTPTSSTACRSCTPTCARARWSRSCRWRAASRARPSWRCWPRFPRRAAR